jgi:uncharacterized sulfatase
MRARALLPLAVASLALPSPDAEAAPSRLNVIHIVSDDLNVDLGCYGHPIVKTPNVDRLAARGMRFDRAYCNYPVCNPSRTSFLSGKRPDTTGIVDNVTPTRTVLKGSVMLPQFFRQHGYRTEKVGKIFHTGDAFEDPPSWDLDVRETSEAKNPPEGQIIRKGKGGVVLNADDADTWDGKVARRAVERIEGAVRDGAPFYVAAGFRRPHTPYIAPKRYFDLYPPSAMTWPAEPPGHVAGIPPIALTYAPGNPTLPESRRAEVMSAYFAAVSFMDAQVGVLLDAIDRLKLWDRTVVVFHGDHGYHLGEHGGLHHKMTLFEEGTRVPLIVAAPGVRAGTVSPRLVELVDLFPTLADLCGLEPPRDLEGVSFRPLLAEPDRPWKAGVFAVVGRRAEPEKGGNGAKLDVNYLGRMVRTERWRYTEWPDGSAELYDEEADPREYANLADRPQLAATRSELKALLKGGWKAALPR